MRGEASRPAGAPFWAYGDSLALWVPAAPSSRRLRALKTRPPARGPVCLDAPRRKVTHSQTHTLRPLQARAGTVALVLDYLSSCFSR